MIMIRPCRRLELPTPEKRVDVLLSLQPVQLILELDLGDEIALVLERGNVLVGELRPFLHDCGPHAGALGLRRCGGRL